MPEKLTHKKESKGVSSWESFPSRFMVAVEVSLHELVMFVLCKQSLDMLDMLLRLSQNRIKTIYGGHT